MLIGIDVGTTAVKATLFDEQGVAHRVFADRYDTHRPHPGHVEQDAEDWVGRVQHALASLSEGVDVSAVGLCSQVNTHVFVGEDGRPLLPAFTWQDGRCDEDAARLDQCVSVQQKVNWWGAPLPIDASHVLARMAHVARVHPDIWKRTRWVMAPKDYCIYRLSGKVVADPMTCFGLVDGELALIPELINLVPGAAERLPPIARFTKVAGKISLGLACAGATLVVGAMDAWSGLFGAGVCKDGQGMYLSGTSEILGIVSPRKIPTPGVIAFPKCEGIVLHAGPTQAGGASAQWLAKLLGVPVTGISALALSAAPAHVPLFLPHLDGERAPVWDTAARGSFSGLNAASGAAELARAVLDGVAYSARLVFDALEASADCRPDTIHVSGGGSASDLWCQIRADVLGRTLKRTASRDAGVLGAALMAGVGSGAFSSLQEAATEFVRFDRTFEPARAETQRHEQRFQSYQLLYRQLKPFNAAMAALR